MTGPLIFQWAKRGHREGGARQHARTARALDQDMSGYTSRVHLLFVTSYMLLRKMSWQSEAEFARSDQYSVLTRESRRCRTPQTDPRGRWRAALACFRLAAVRDEVFCRVPLYRWRWSECGDSVQWYTCLCRTLLTCTRRILASQERRLVS